MKQKRNLLIPLLDILKRKTAIKQGSWIIYQRATHAFTVLNFGSRVLFVL